MSVNDLDKRITGLESRRDPEKHRPGVVSPQEFEAMSSSGTWADGQPLPQDGGFIVVSPTLPADEWQREAVRVMATMRELADAELAKSTPAAPAAEPIPALRLVKIS